MKRFSLHIFPFLVLLCISLQTVTEVISFGDEIHAAAVHDTGDEKNAEGKESKKLDKEEKDDKFFTTSLTRSGGLHITGFAHCFQTFTMDLYIEIISPPPELS